MMKSCVVLNGLIINVGEWDFKILPFEVQPEIRDEAGDVIQEAVFEDRVTNPFPEGAEIVEMEFDEVDTAWYPANYLPPETSQQKIVRLESEVNELTLMLGDLVLGGGPV